MKKLTKNTILGVVTFLMFINFFGFITGLLKTDPLVNEECNSRIPPIMFMYHFACYITGNTYK